MELRTALKILTSARYGSFCQGLVSQDENWLTLIKALKYIFWGQDRLLEPIGLMAYLVFRVKGGYLELLYSILG